LQQGKVTQLQIDFACRKILEAKFKLGLFDDPYRYCDEQRSKTEIFTAANRKVAKRDCRTDFRIIKEQ
jgi:beta-glucosidase